MKESPGTTPPFFWAAYNAPLGQPRAAPPRPPEPAARPAHLMRSLRQQRLAAPGNLSGRRMRRGTWAWPPQNRGAQKILCVVFVGMSKGNQTEPACPLRNGVHRLLQENIGKLCNNSKTRSLQSGEVSFYPSGALAMRKAPVCCFERTPFQLESLFHLTPQICGLVWWLLWGYFPHLASIESGGFQSKAKPPIQAAN